MNRALFFSDLAKTPDAMSFKPEHEPGVERLRRRLGPLRGKRVLEPGCGSGPLTCRLADWVGREGRVLAADACAEMAAHCSTRLADCAHVQVLHAPVEDLDLPPATWDLVLCFRLFPHLDQPRRFLARCRDWLAPGGRLVIAHLEGSRQLNEWHAQRPGVCGDRMPSGTRLRRMLQADGWAVDTVTDDPLDFFLQARPVSE